MSDPEIYARKVLSGEILAGRYVKMAAQRFLDDLKRKDIYWDAAAVKKKMILSEEVIYIPELKRKNKVPLPHKFWIEQLYGWKYKKTGLRRFTSVYVQVARKNFKTFYAADVTLTELLISNDTYPEILHGANSREQALICTGKTGEIIKKSPELAKMLGKNNSGNLKLFTYREDTGKITFENSNRRGKVEAMPKNPGDGGNPSVGIVDEFHESKDTMLMETIKSGQGQRLEPLTLVITSPGNDKSLPCYTQLRAVSIKTLEGTLENDRHLAMVWELDEEEEWDKIEMMEKSNPMIPYSPTLLPFLKERILEAKRYGGQQAANIKIKNCGLWIDQPQIWLETSVIKKNNKLYKDDEDQLEGEDCYCGLDLSAGGDLNAFVMIFPDIGGRMVVKSMFWIPRDKIEGKDKDRDGVDYRKWEEDGWVRVFDGNMVEYDVIAQDMIDEMDKYNVRCLAIDPKYFGTGVAPFFKDTNYLELIVPVSQGFSKLSGATEKVEQLCLSEKMDFMYHPVMSWCFSNVALKVGEMGDRFPGKGKSNGRIDGVAALVTGMAQYLEMNLNDEGGFFAFSPE
jgi:phage terminase large subunit-like protein